VKLKDPSQFRYVGKPLKRLDTAGKITGKTEFGIDVKLPGMLYASLAQCPVIGGKVASFDDSKAKKMPGVKHIVGITDGVAVVADSWWQAKQARDALNVTWDEGPNKNLSSEGVFKGLNEAMAKPAASIKQQGNVARR
jgi:isoquinoline 1-oxidoreductase beta subunit